MHDRLLLLLFLVLCTGVRAQNNDGFLLDSEEDGVSVWIRAEKNGDMSVRVETVVRNTVEGVRMLLDDADRYPEWVHRCASARILSADDGSDYLFVSRIDLPFPFSDKVVVAGVRQRVKADGSLVRTIVAQPDAIARVKGEERLQVYYGEWIVSPDSPTHTVTVNCTVRTDAGAGLPDWIRREILTGGPVKTMANLRRRLEEKVR